MKKIYKKLFLKTRKISGKKNNVNIKRVSNPDSFERFSSQLYLTLLYFSYHSKLDLEEHTPTPLKKQNYHEKLF